MLGRLSLTHVLLFVIILVLLFGARRLPELGGAMAKTIKEFKRAMKDSQDGDHPKAAPPKE
jgi:sec-independent protein translocase protein TatA